MAPTRPNDHLDVVVNDTSEIKNGTPREDLLVRKAKRAEEAISSMAEYEQNQRATLEKTAKLRAARLAQQAGTVEKTPPQGDLSVGSLALFAPVKQIAGR